MTNKFSYVSPKIKTGASKINKKGLFAISPIKKGEIICITTGRIIKDSDINRTAYKKFGYHCIQIEKGFHICPSKPKSSALEAAFFMNHSCNPNAGIRGQLTFVALRDIRLDEEVTYDYATTDNYYHKMKCTCDAENCRKIITGKEWKRKDIQRKYKNYFSSYIISKIKNKTQ